MITYIQYWNFSYGFRCIILSFRFIKLLMYSHFVTYQISKEFIHKIVQIFLQCELLINSCEIKFDR
ncbi:unnamed protein product [Paramecium octaurelia]|uniref:Uncharacterized protein n=1 Tax=Paramecium octaurelia TaxID=43137 RepID=A0A8S1X2U6_PAROT|nr:unnamed protein product [Paramecium octaurelia]